MDENAGVAHEGGIGVAVACHVARNGKATPVQVCPRHTDVPVCTHTYTHTYMYAHTHTSTHAQYAYYMLTPQG